MIIVTKEQFFNFIKSQPNDRELDFSSSISNDDGHGCPMLHYAKENFDKPIYYALASAWISERTESGFIVHAKFDHKFGLDLFYCNAVNYGQLKAHLYKVHPDFDWN
jgi:hypothetical protein